MARKTAISSALPESSRLPPPEVKPVERDDLRYQQDLDGAPRARDQDFGYLNYLQVFDMANGQELCELKVYSVPVQAGLEADVREVYFAPDPGAGP